MVYNKTYGDCATKEKSYICAGGKCDTFGFNCLSVNLACIGVSGFYRCAEGNCVNIESHCLRPCGTSFTTYKLHTHEPVGQYNYNTSCPGYIGKCARYESLCPPYCPGKSICEGACIKSGSLCRKCYGGRCNNDGSCYSTNQRCNYHNYCTDGSDELNCTSYTNNDSSDGLHIDTTLWYALAVVFMILVVGCSMYFRRRGRGGAGRFNSQQATPQTTGAQPIIIRGTAIPIAPLNIQMTNLSQPAGYPAQPGYGSPPSLPFNGANPPYPISGPYGPLPTQDPYATQYSSPTLYGTNLLAAGSPPDSDLPPSYADVMNAKNQT